MSLQLKKITPNHSAALLMSPYWDALTKVTITSVSFGTRMLAIVFNSWRWQNLLSSFERHNEKVFCSLQGEEDSHHSSVAVGRLGCCPETLKCLVLGTAEAQGSNRTAAEEKVLCLEKTWGLGVTKSSATARKKTMKNEKCWGQLGLTNMHTHTFRITQNPQDYRSKSHSGCQSGVY